eukprot:2522891-Lingulodinium_polyedra.AAC.1
MRRHLLGCCAGPAQPRLDVLPGVAQTLRIRVLADAEELLRERGQPLVGLVRQHKPIARRTTQGPRQ